MKFQTLKFPVALAMALPLVAAVTAMADDAPFCHDMPARQAVLEEGKEFLKTHGEGPGRPSRDSRSFPLPAETGYGNRGVDIFTKPLTNVSEAKLQSMILETPAQLMNANIAAHNLESVGQFKLAKILFKRLLPKAETNAIFADQLAQVLESAGRSEILSESNIHLPDTPDLIETKYQRKVNPFETDGQSPKVTELTAGPALIQLIIKNLAANSKQFIEADGFYSRALALRRARKAFYHPFISDLLIVATFRDQQNKQEEAKALFIEAFEREPLSGCYLAAFLTEHHDFNLTKQNEAKILKAAVSTGDSSAITTLLTFYLAEGKSRDALELFRQTIHTSVFLPGKILIAMLDVIQPDDLAQVNHYLKDNWLAAPAIDSDFKSTLLALEKHGWGSQADSLCDAIVRNFPRSPNRLFAIADCYFQTKKIGLSLSVYGKIATAIEDEHGPDQAAIEKLSALIKAINEQVALKQTPESQAILTKANQLIAFHKDQIRRRQCLDMADKLNHTAFELDRNNHFDMAQKLYQQALEIKQLNLSANDPETAIQMIDVARSAAAQNHFKESQALYERALAILKKNPRSNPSDTILALENYGQLLNQMKLTAQADKIYNEARVLSKTLKH